MASSYARIYLRICSASLSKAEFRSRMDSNSRVATPSESRRRMLCERRSSTSRSSCSRRDSWLRVLSIKLIFLFFSSETARYKAAFSIRSCSMRRVSWTTFITLLCIGSCCTWCDCLLFIRIGSYPGFLV